MANDVEIEGLKELNANLKRLADYVGDKHAESVVKNALRKGARLVRDEAKGLVPVDEGNVRDAIAVRTERKGAARDEVAAYVVVKKYANGVPTYYARFLEFGTEKMSAKPFMRPAFEKVKRQLPGILAAAMRTRIDKFIGGLPK